MALTVLLGAACSGEGDPQNGPDALGQLVGGNSEQLPPDDPLPCEGLDLFDECDTDADLCTIEYCDPGGACVFSGEIDACEAQNAFVCLTYECAAAQGCAPVQFNDGLGCDDLDSCTTQDVCVQVGPTAGYCGGVPIDDGDPCTQDACVDGEIVVLAAAECTDGVACTADSCDPQTGACVHELGPGFCLIDGACIAEQSVYNDGCLECDPAADPTGWTANDALCDDAAECAVAVCDPEDGCVVGQPAPDGGPCDDGGACTQSDSCTGGACGGAPVDCDDNNVCTKDLCSEAAGCVYVALSGACSDGDPCTTGDVCDQGVCVVGAAISCDDGQPCTVDADCADGGCAPSLPIVCDDGDACTADPTCAGGVCPPAAAIACDDGDACNGVESCQAGECAAGEALSCSDLNPCTADSCDALAGCVIVPLDAPCDDGNACTVGDTCVAGACESGPGPDCDDGNPCTDDLCGVGAGCQNVQVFKPCDDGDACTTGDVCSGGACAGAVPLDCDDGEGCTVDSCDVLLGCANQPIAGGCSDGDACTSDDVCAAGVCEPGAAVGCDDGNPCTDELCDAALGCLVSDNAAPCDDGDLCTDNACIAGVCQLTGVVECDDGEQCTVDACNPATGCHNASLAEGAGCDDGDACTGVCTLAEKLQVQKPHPGFPSFAFIGFGPIDDIVFLDPTADTFFEVDVDGAARLYGPLAHKGGLPAEDAAKSWSIDCRFQKRAGPGSGGPFIQEQFQNDFADQWEYFDIVEGKCTMGTADGAWSLVFTEKPSPGVFPLQKGPGASSFTDDIGFSNWVDYVLFKDGAKFTTAPNGDALNTDFHGKLLPVDACTNLDVCQAGKCVAGAEIAECAP